MLVGCWAFEHTACAVGSGKAKRRYMRLTYMHAQISARYQVLALSGPGSPLLRTWGGYWRWLE